jgi:hypothetical protein
VADTRLEPVHTFFAKYPFFSFKHDHFLCL